MFWTIGLTQKNGNRLTLLVAVMLSAMMLPSFPITSGLPRIRPDEVMLFGLYGLNILYFLFRGLRFDTTAKEILNEERKPLKEVRLVFLLLLGSIVLSNVYGVLFLNNVFSFRDAMEFVTLFKYYLVITLVISLDLNREGYGWLKIAVFTGFVFLLLLSWGQNLNLFNMNEWLSPFFNPVHWDTLIYGNPRRVIGAFDNPNVMAMFTVILLSIFTTRFYFSKDDFKFSLMMFALVGITIKLVFLTISRTGFLAIGTVLVYLSIRALLRHRFDRTIIIKTGALLLLTLTLFYTGPRGFTQRMHEATDLSTSTSARGHLLQLGDAFNAIKESPILGWGTSKATMTTRVDNEYALMTRRYGTLGLIIYLWFFLKPFIIANRFIARRTRYADVRFIDIQTLIALSFTGAGFAVAVYNLTAGIFYNLQLMTLFSVFMGLIYHTEREQA